MYIVHLLVLYCKDVGVMSILDIYYSLLFIARKQKSSNEVLTSESIIHNLIKGLIRRDQWLIC